MEKIFIPIFDFNFIHYIFKDIVYRNTSVDLRIFEILFLSIVFFDTQVDFRYVQHFLGFCLNRIFIIVQVLFLRTFVNFYILIEVFYKKVLILNFTYINSAPVLFHMFIFTDVQITRIFCYYFSDFQVFIHFLELRKI